MLSRRLFAQRSKMERAEGGPHHLRPQATATVSAPHTKVKKTQMPVAKSPGGVQDTLRKPAYDVASASFIHLPDVRAIHLLDLAGRG